MYIILGLIIALLILLIIYMANKFKHRREYIDEITGAKNDFAFEQEIGSAIKLNSDCLVFIFKFKNKSKLSEKYGSLMDTLTIDTASSLKKFIGKDRVYYLQQGKFAIILPRNISNPNDYSMKLVDKVQKRCRLKDFIYKDNILGAIIKVPSDAKFVGDIYQTYKRLDVLSVNSKDYIYDSGYIDFAYKKRYFEIDDALERALKADSFEVYYQPIYGILEDSIIACEALIRLKDSKLGQINPEEFIPIAEKSGKILEIGKCVIRKVCLFLNDDEIKNLDLKYVEINLSIQECMQRDLTNKIMDILAEYNISPNRINLEIRESALENKEPILQDNLETLSEAGFSISLDEYGTGYSTLTYVMTLPFNFVKIDRNLLWNAMESSKAMYALCASINMLKDMDTKIVVAGVETEQMVDTLKSLKCDYLQGFYFAKPMPAIDFIDYMK